MVSAVNQREKLTECIKLGAIDFIVKPFEKTQLVSLFTKQGRPR
jgi:response regulator of citrate/malate metabolism